VQSWGAALVVGVVVLGAGIDGARAGVQVDGSDGARGRALIAVGDRAAARTLAIGATVEAAAARAAGAPVDGPTRAPAVARAPLPFHRDPACGDGGGAGAGAGGRGCALKAEAKVAGAATIVATLDEAEGVDGARLLVEARLAEPLWLTSLAVELEIEAASIEIVGRDLRPRLVAAGGKPVWLERFDPKWIRLRRAATVGERADLVIAVGDGVDAVRIAPPARAGGVARVRLALVDAAARPFVHDARCVKRWRDPNRRLGHPFRLFHPGEIAPARASLESADEGPVVLSRWPDGRRAAFSITDHADQSDVNTFVALTDALLAEGLRITKALFAAGAAPRRQLDDARVVAAAERLRAAGSEIIPHSITPQPDPRAMLERGLASFARFEPKTWIDHQPATNCEAIGAAGWRSDGKWGIADLLARFGFRYVWLEVDAPRGIFNLLDPRHLEARAPTVWPLGRLDAAGPASLWMFKSVWAFFSNRAFYSFYAPPRLDALERDRGLHVAHTYLETYHRPGTLFGRRNLFVPADPKRDRPGGAGPVALAPKFRALLADLGARQRRGTLWVAPIAEIADRLRATADVSLVRTPGGALRVTTPSAIPGATFVVLGRDVTARLDGAPVPHRRLEEGATWLWADLGAGEHVLELSDVTKSARR
jgi:hypothetical protein